MRQTDVDVDPYAQIVELYDLEHDLYVDDLALIKHLVETVGDPVLELACGSGRVLGSLAGGGKRLTGVDSSPAMLEAARRRLGHPDKNLSLVEARMTALPLPDTDFGIAILTLNGLLHSTTPAEQRTALTEAFRCLDPRGMLYVDVANPAVTWPLAGPQPVVFEGIWTRANGDTVQKFQSIAVDPARQLVSTSLWYDISDREGILQRRATSFDLRYLHAAELELMLEVAGFVEWQIYGSYELDPFTAESPRIIALAEKTPSR